MNIKKVEHDVFSKLSQSNLTKLNLSICKDTKITLKVPIIISESIDKLNISSGYYNDICYIATSDSGTDITLNDRKEEYKANNNIICQEECDFSSYNYNTNEAICSCHVRESSSSIDNMYINKEKIYERFIDIKNILNIKIIICYKVLFSKDGTTHNIAFYLIIIIMIFHVFSIFIFYYNNRNILKQKINEIIFAINNWELLKVYEKEKRKIERNIKKINVERMNNVNKDININHSKKKSTKNKRSKKEIKIQNPFDFFLNTSINKTNPPIKHKNELNINNIIKNNDSLKNMILESINRKEIVKKVREIISFNDEELNNLDYKLALKFDKRTFCEYYLSLIKTKHILIFTFYSNKNDYNSRIIKIDLLFIGFTTDFFINALFFNDDTMHRIYEEKGNFNFLYHLPPIIYSTLISFALNSLVQKLALSEDIILDFKNNKNRVNLDQRVKKLLKVLRIKFILYFITVIVLLLFFLYYLSMFCAVYRNTQIHLIKDTLISFRLSLINPFVIYLLPGIFRIYALSDVKSKRNFIYNLSLILQMI